MSRIIVSNFQTHLTCWKISCLFLFGIIQTYIHRNPYRQTARSATVLQRADFYDVIGHPSVWLAGGAGRRVAVANQKSGCDNYPSYNTGDAFYGPWGTPRGTRLTAVTQLKDAASPGLRVNKIWLLEEGTRVGFPRRPPVRDRGSDGAGTRLTFLKLAPSNVVRIMGTRLEGVLIPFGQFVTVLWSE